MILFVDDTHLNEPYKRTLLTACTLDVENHLFNFTYGILCGEKIEEWGWFLKIVVECLGVLKPMIMSDRNPTIIVPVAQVFGKEYHSYYQCHMTENFLQEAMKHSI